MIKNFLKIGLAVTLCFLWAGLLMLSAQEKKDQDASEKIWKKLDKSRIPGGIWISKTGRYAYFPLQKGFHMTEIRDLLEKVGLNEQVSIELILDFSAVVDLGTYKPILKEDKQGKLKLSFESIPNLKELETNATYREYELYRLNFKNAEGKVKASILVRVKTD